MNINDFTKEFNFRDLDINRAGSWPMGVKLISYLLVFLLIATLGYFFYLQEKKDNLAQAKTKSIKLHNEYENKAFKVANIDIYRDQMQQIELMLSNLLRQLPSDTEVPTLLEDITHTGLGSGLEFKSITLKPETHEDFFIELPFELVVKGDYHEMGSFISGVAAMSRIVTLHNFTIEKDEESNDLLMIILAKTYRYEANEDI